MHLPDLHLKAWCRADMIHSCSAAYLYFYTQTLAAPCAIWSAMYPTTKLKYLHAIRSLKEMRNIPTVDSRQNRPLRTACLMGLEKIDFKIIKRYLGKSFGHILKANDVKHHIIQMQPDLMILMAP
jgi:hypothetical protein